MGCTSSSVGDVNAVEEVIVRPPERKGSTISQAATKQKFRLTDFNCHASVRQLDSEGKLRLSIAALPSDRCLDAWVNVEAACKVNCFPILAAHLEINGQKACLSFDLATCYGEPLKTYEAEATEPLAHFEVHGEPELGGSAEEKGLLYLTAGGLNKAWVRDALMDISEDHGYHVVRARYSTTSRAPNAAKNGEVWLRRSTDLNRPGDIQSMIKSLETRMDLLRELEANRAEVASTVTPTSEGSQSSDSLSPHWN